MDWNAIRDGIQKNPILGTSLLISIMDGANGSKQCVGIKRSPMGVTYFCVCVWLCGWVGGAGGGWTEEP